MALCLFGMKPWEGCTDKDLSVEERLCMSAGQKGNFEDQRRAVILCR
jgi:hypothetical protein